MALLYGGVTPPAGFVEFRFLPSKGRAWMPWPAFEGHPDEFTAIPQKQNAYFGISLRRDQQDGTAQNVHPTHLVWLDIDLKGTPWVHGQLDVQNMTPEELRECAEAAFRHYLAAFLAADLPPRAVVYTGHGLQVYWARRARSDLADTEAYNRGLAAAFDGDPKTVDAARIFRLPGSLNLKNRERPLPVELWHQDPDAWVERDALEGYRYVEKPKPAPVSQPAELTGTAQERYAQAALQREVEAVRATGEGGRNDQLNRSAFAVGTLIGAGILDEVEAERQLREAAEAVGLDAGEIRDTLHSGLEAGKAEPRDLSGVGLKPERQPAAQGTIGKDRVRSEAAGVPGLEAPRPPVSGVYVQHGVYYIDRPVKKGGEVVDWYPEQLTNWVWEPNLKLHYPDGTYGERGTLIVRGGGHHELQLGSSAWNSRKDLLETVGGYQARCFTTNNSDIAKIGDYIAATYPDLPGARGVKSYGLHLHEGEWVEVFENRTISSGDTPPLFYSGTPVDPGSRAFKAPRLATPAQVDEARRAIVKLPGLITPAVAYALLGYGAASAFSPRITPHLGNRLPFVYVAGERESGKTSGAQIALELMTGYSARLTKASGMTAYQYDIAHSSANNSLALLDEYRPGEIDDGQLRKHHDLGTKWRGSGMASKNLAYELNAPLVVLGEGFTDDAATKSRGVLYFTRKQDRGGLDGYSEVLKLPLWAYAAHLHELARTTGEKEHLARIQRATDLAGQAIGGTANPRLRYALTYIAYGLLVLQDDLEVIPDTAILDTLREGVHNTLEGGSEGVTNLELFLEQLAFVLTKVPSPGMYVVPGALPTDLLIRPKACLDLVQAHYRERAAIANTTLLKQYAEQASYFAAGDVHKSYEGHPVRAKRVTLSQVPERCDADLLEEFNRRLRQ
ncbi:Superfamily II helicase-like protein [Deinococcus phoenicis]|uniref:Superfamily II helicase-like protein n=1 Tax=Deinococcus phoenicis TaxID=1476583 RepID=A0A016QLZ0_9DEIO|nr:Superfamily II helicase-like protein [Deinococcus phoenicis]